MSLRLTVGAIPQELQGDSANSLFYKKVRSNILSLFPWIHIEDSTFPHQPKAGGPPFLSRTGNVSQAFLFLDFLFLRFRKVEEV